MRSAEEKKASQEATCQDCRTDSRRRALLAAAVESVALSRILKITSLTGVLMSSGPAWANTPTVEYDLTGLAAGQVGKVEWMGKTVWIVHRTAGMLADLRKNDRQLLDPDSRYSVQPEQARNEGRSLNPEYFVCVGICTHMGCPLNPKPRPGTASGLGEDWTGGFLCLCHGSRFDLAGRVYEGVPATANLEIPPYFFGQENRLIIGALRPPKK